MQNQRLYTFVQFDKKISTSKRGNYPSGTETEFPDLMGSQGALHWWCWVNLFRGGPTEEQPYPY